MTPIYGLKNGQIKSLTAQGPSSVIERKLLLLAAIWPKYHSGNWALRYNFVVKTLRYMLFTRRFVHVIVNACACAIASDNINFFFAKFVLKSFE